MAARRRARQVQIRTLMLAIALAAVGFAVLRLPGGADWVFGILVLLVFCALMLALAIGIGILSDRAIDWWVGPAVPPPDDPGPGRDGDGPA